MKKYSIFIFLVCIIIILGGCNSKLKNSSNSLEITKEYEGVILEYLDKNTDDINSPRNGKMYSAFNVLGTDTDKIYVWMLKEEFLKQNSEINMTNGVSLPLVLYINTEKDKIEIINHKYPEDGEGYGRSLKKLFPQNVIKVMNDNHNESVEKLEEIIKNRVKEDIKI
ncbi:hypothetical protein [Clostridium sp.]|uniref:hypothetical protein n=1 Tax=Clostridium sp. TaxID=1506 RepID=UPI002FCAB4A6